MIIVLVRVEVHADNLSSLKEAMNTMERESRAEAGCQDYVFATEISAPSVMRVVERWDDMAALQFHFSTPHMATFNAAIGNLGAGPMEIKVYEVAREVALPGAS